MPASDGSPPALVLRLDRNPFHHGTLGAVRSLGRAGVEVHALVEAADSPVARSRHLRRAHVRPPGEMTPALFVETLLTVSDRIGRRAVLIAMDDFSAIEVAAQSSLLDSRFLFPRQPDGLPERLADKSGLAELCAAAGIAHPATLVPGSAAEAAAAARSLGLPAVAKWSRPWLLAPGAAELRSTTLVTTPDDARRLYDRSEAAGSSLLLQRLVPGGPATDWFFHGCFATRSPGPAACLLGGTGRKELSWPPRTGLTAMGRCAPNPAVREAALRLASHTGYRGILDLDFRRDEPSGTYCLLDVNPRPGAQFRLFTDPAGLDVVRALYLDLTGRDVPAGDPKAGRVFIAENYALISALAARSAPLPSRRRPPRTATAPAEPPAGVETAWFAGDDPLPFLAMARTWLGRGLGKAVRRLRRGPRRAAPADARPAVPGPAEHPTRLTDPNEGARQNHARCQRNP